MVCCALESRAPLDCLECDSHSMINISEGFDFGGTSNGLKGFLESFLAGNWSPFAAASDHKPSSPDSLHVRIFDRISDQLRAINVETSVSGLCVLQGGFESLIGAGFVHFIRSVFLRLDRRRWAELNPSLGYRQQEIAFFSTFFKRLKNQRKP